MVKTAFSGAKTQQFYRAVVQHILKHKASTLVPRTKDLIRPDSPYYNQDNPWRDFTFVVDMSLALSTQTEALRLLDAAYDRLTESRAAWVPPVPKTDRQGAPPDNHRYGAVVSDFLQPLTSVLQEHNVPPSSPILKKLYELVLREGIHRRIPTCPTPLPGWANKLRGCGLPACNDCRALAGFLISQDRVTWKFSAAKPRRTHIERFLPHELFKLTTQATRSPFTLIVEKIRGAEFSAELRSYRQIVGAVGSTVAPLRHDYVCEMLGHSDYVKLVLLGDTQGEGGVAGTKRAASEDAGLVPALRQRVE